MHKYPYAHTHTHMYMHYMNTHAHTVFLVWFPYRSALWGEPVGGALRAPSKRS